MRVHFLGSTMTYRQADTLLYYLENKSEVISAKVYERTRDAVIRYKGERRRILEMLRSFCYDKVVVPNEVLETSGRALNAAYQEKIIDKILFRWIRKWFLPYPMTALYTAAMSVKYIYQGLKILCKGKIEVPVLDATAIGVSILRNDFDTASSIMFFLSIGELLEEWTHKKSVDDLARMMSLNVEKVWIKKNDQEILVAASTVKKGDLIVVHMGNVIPFDGTVIEGEAMINQAALTGESVPVRRSSEDSVYAGTVLEEGEITLRVEKTGGSSRFEKIVTMIEASEKLKSSLEGKAEHLADQLVPYTFAGTGLVYLLTRNVTKALSVLMVDFSCAMKLAMPISVLSAIREASKYHLTVKGGKYLEAVAEADTIVFDKTGTLTKAHPTVVDVISFNGDDPDELLRVAACMEEHFPHSMAKAVVYAAKKRNLEHEEMHSKVEYMVAHGISTEIEGKRAVIGSYHFVFEDEKCRIPEGKEELFESLSGEYSHLYLAMEQELAAVIRIEDPLRDEAVEVIRLLKEEGIANIVMMTGDSERTAASIAKRVGVDDYDSEVLPEEKARFVEKERAKGKKVIMIGDGINDSPALSAADVGIAISDGAELAREIADITISADNLYELVLLKRLSDRLMQRIGRNYRLIVGINAALIALGVAGILQPTASALFHNTSTLFIGLDSMKNLME
ncbi:heavy metal translocating P-type ATPase [Faecalimonas umbilicata]|uniref:heavy metal translocating P-type ATPase n=1 Tax=Faecalimonas umbilicata TaxID=1912855 RepID=UPI002A81BE9D|nr:heavy metal translocating P-type ATPase [Faecalimonas umbilicata]MDY4596321.1 heavy metal translocating P-type ATPase [Faecalimonas umbilicata]